jgi:hypothetical protein
MDHDGSRVIQFADCGAQFLIHLQRPARPHQIAEPDFARIHASRQGNVYTLKFGIPEDGPKTVASLDLMERNRPPFDSTYSYYPEVLYRFGRNDSAYRYLLEISDPGFSGYHMAETAFVAIAGIGSGLMGIDPDAPQSTVENLPPDGQPV